MKKSMNMMQFIRGNQPYFEDFVTRSTYHSNAIEGNTLSYAETYELIFLGNSLTITGTAREIYEAINHKYAMDYLFRQIENPLTERMIKDIAELINRNINEFSGYRKVQVFIQGAQHIPPAPQQIPTQMMYLVHNYNSAQYTNIFEKIAATHIAFERIHPFEDGNGRTGRLLINFELLKNDYAPVVIPKEQRARYMSILDEEDAAHLASFLQRLSEQELERIQSFLPQQESIALEP